MQIRILVSPLAKAAYFDAWAEVAQAELAACGIDASQVSVAGGMDFLEVDASEGELKSLARMSFAQGLFRVEGEGLVPLETSADFSWPEALVYGLWAEQFVDYQDNLLGVDDSPTTYATDLAESYNVDSVLCPCP